MRNKLKMYIFTLFTVLFGLSTTSSMAGAVSFSQSGTYVYDVNGRIVTFMSKDGTTISYQYDRNGNLLKKVPVQILGYLDSPATNEVSSPYVHVKGWYLSDNGVESIKVFVNNEYKGMATYGDSREDVHNAYPKFNNHNSGYHFDTVLPNITQSYNIKVVVRDKRGIETYYERTVNYKKLSPIGYLDSPTEGQNMVFYGSVSSTHPDNQITISGWYLDMAPVKSISVYIDNSIKYSGTINRMSRLDVYNVYPQYGDKNSGFQITVPKPPAAARYVGKTLEYTLKVVVENILGEQTIWVRNFKVFYEDPTDPGSWT